MEDFIGGGAGRGSDTSKEGGLRQGPCPLGPAGAMWPMASLVLAWGCLADWFKSPLLGEPRL